MMQINTDMNILGGLSDWDLVKYYYFNYIDKNSIINYTSIKTNKSIQRFQGAINKSLLKFKKKELEFLFKSIISTEGISRNALYFLFWNMANNNDLFHLINLNVFFESYYNGKVLIKNDEIIAYLNDLKTKEKSIQN